MLKEERHVLALEKALAALNGTIQAKREEMWATARNTSFTIRPGRWIKETYNIIGKPQPRDRTTYRKIPDRGKVKEIEALEGEKKEIERRLILARTDLQVALIEKGQAEKASKLTFPRTELEALCSRIDQEYDRIAREEGLTLEKVIYARIAARSVKLLGTKLTARQLEGKHKRWKLRKGIKD